MAQTTVLVEPLIMRLREYRAEMDRELPLWARRSHPVVRRHLGIYWKTLPMPVLIWVRLVALQAVYIALTLPAPILFAVIMPVIVVSVVLIPAAFVVYAHVLYGVLALAVMTMLDERLNGTLDLLLVTPLSLDHILFSKIAAAIWRNLDNLGLVFIAHVLFGLPPLIVHYASLYPPEHAPFLVRGAIIAALIVNMIRLLFEPILVGAIGVLIGTLVQPRPLALATAAALCAAYFALINLPRLINLSAPLRLLVEIGLPLALPVALTWLALRLTVFSLRRD